ncbi:MAG: hypothetical protein A2252_08065 [Elusimicrobia bacterium RIFOXYA2_FULL_39_19]|nr:MAG: hypothetical protein A2252_08065 [Elusimicrobia bacterium RIFOXYA2_FULL_39_19]
MKLLRWFIGLILIALIIAVNLKYEFSPLMRMVNFLIPSCILCLWRIYKGPTPADRVVAIDILGILVIGFCGVLTVFTDKIFFIEIAIAWALQSFIATIALAKYLEGKKFDD